jgi:hypothetical protein
MTSMAVLVEISGLTLYCPDTDNIVKQPTYKKNGNFALLIMTKFGES